MTSAFPLDLPLRPRSLVLSGLPAAMGIGLLSALFFSVSFVANRGLALGGGAWEWTAALRYFITLPIFFAVVAARRGLGPVVHALKVAPVRWTLWGSVGFGLFYAPLCFASVSAPGWVIAAVWQVTIVCGVVLAPLLYRDAARRRVPAVAVGLSLLVLAGVGLTIAEAPGGLHWSFLGGIAAVLVGAVAYPVGNRKSMDLGGGLDTFQRVLVMTVGSLPCWIVLAVVGGVRAGAPSGDQLVGTLVVAVSSGVVATALFFAATRRVRDNPTHLAAVEATQASEVVFVALAEPLVLGAGAPGPAAWVGIGIITVGVTGYAMAGRVGQ
ncbi:multidrug resistance efflux transporter family protein [Actinokineospora sp. G85]|uniref:DMT family transporter n=1 Tax=Actinokineospora sp. G85 TaxID=3406626 RepID=UPI003C771FCE